MASIDIVLDKLVCHATTEWFHDEVYYLATVTRKSASGGVSTDAAALIGPTGAQGATSDRGNVPQGAWETDDGDEGSLDLAATLFPVQVGAGEHLVVTLTLMESDGDNYADIETRAAAVAAGVLGAVTVAFPPSASVTAPVGLALAAVTSVAQAVKGYVTNSDDVLGSIALVLEGVGAETHVVQVGASGTVTATAADGQPALLTARLKGDGADYEVTVSARDALMAQSVVRQDPDGPHVRDHRGDGTVVAPSGPVVRDHRSGAAQPVVRDHR